MRKLLGMLLCVGICLVLGLGTTGCTKKKTEEKKTEETKKTGDKKTEETKKTEEKKTGDMKTEEKKTEEKKTEEKPADKKIEEKKTEEKKTEEKKGAFLAPAARDLFAILDLNGIHTTHASLEGILPRHLRG
jgi:uncharacterized protein HemX